jgi:hypothetical protein
VRALVRDVDADGKPDVLVAYGGTPPGYLVLWNDSLVGGASPTDVPLSDNVFDVALVNADADPALEVAVLELNSGGSFVVSVGDIDRAGASAPTPVVSLADAAGRVHVADVNGDGLDDLVVPPHVFLAVPFDPKRDQPPDPGDGGGGGDGGGDGEQCSGVCELVSQCGCSDGQSCDLSNGEIGCRPATATGTEATECEFNDDCAAGYSCIDVLNLGRGECLPWCASDGDCAAPGGACDLPISANGQIVPGAVVCTASCDPLDNTGCPADWSCHAFQKGDGSRHESICTPAGGGGQGAFCSEQDECQPGFTCLGFANECSRNCAISPASNNCPAGTACQAYSDHPTFGGVEYGFCQ